MLSIVFDSVHRAFILRLHGALTQEDVGDLTDHVDGYINEHDAVPSLVIHAPEFPGWEDFETLVKQMRFVRNHHALVPKIAVVSDNAALSILPHLANHFAKAEIRRFPIDRLEAAKNWVSDPDTSTGRIDWIDWLPRDVVGFRIAGTITAKDYEEILLPVIRVRLAEHDRLKLLCQLGEDFDGFTAGAIWDDAKFGLLHLGDFSRIAIVSDIDWVRHSAKLFGPLLRGRVHVFNNSEFEDARQWVKA